MSVHLRPLIKKYFFEIILFLSFFAFACLLMWKTFRVDLEGNMQLASRLWSDFAATIPLIRSFSYGSNFPPQYPIFSGPPIRYHFVFFAVVGLLEKAGLRIDWALNSASTLAFFLLCVSIYLLGKIIFKSRTVGVISSLLFLFNGSFGFVEFFKKHPLSPNTFTDILKNTEFTSFGPYDGKIVSAFWSLNIFTNQRHLALAYAVVLFLILAIYHFSKHPDKLTWNIAFLIGLLIGLFPFIHLAGFAMLGITLATFFVVYPKLRLKLLTAGLIAIILALPQYLYMGFSGNNTKLFAPGYLVTEKTLFGYLKYWTYNLGLTLFLAPLGFVLSKSYQRKIFLPFLILFIVGNLFQFSPEVAANHKFFNLFAIGANLFTANFLIKLSKVKILGKLAAFSLIIPLVFTGIIDFFPIKNDRLITLVDIPNNKVANFILKNTPKDSVFLNSSYLSNPASLAGRKIFMGWPYFSWSAGYNTDQRQGQMQQMFNPGKKEFLCRDLEKYNIDYVETQKPIGLEGVTVNYSFFEENFKPIFEDHVKKITIFSVEKSCKI